MMTRSCAMIAWALWSAALCLGVHGDPYRMGDSFAGFQGMDQHGKEFAFQPGSYRFVIFETPGESGEAPPPKDPTWFEQNKAMLLINISDFSTFKRRIARGRMEAKPFRLVIVDDAQVAARFPQQKGKFTVLRLDENGVVKEILFPAPGKELQDLIASPGQ